MSGDQDRGSGKNRIRTLWMASMVGCALVALSVVLGRGAFDPWRVLGLYLVVVAWIVLAIRLLKVQRAGVVVLIVGVVATVGGFTAAFVTAPPEPRCPQVPTTAGSGFGTAVTYDGFEYVLTAVDTNPPAAAARAPLGEWFVVHGTVTNIDDYQRRFPNVRMFVTVCGDTYSPDGGLSTRPMDMNPGLTADVTLVYDVPAGFPSGDPAVIRIGSVYVPWNGSEGSQ